jgi:hypothetical protein
MLPRLDKVKGKEGLSLNFCSNIWLNREKSVISRRLTLLTGYL